MVSVSLISCVKEGASFEKTPSLITGSDELAPGPDEGEYILSVSSNRSWKLITSEDCDWVETNVSESVNLAGKTETVPVTIKVKENPVRESRSASLVFFCEGSSKSVKIVQKRARPSVSYSFEERDRYLDPSFFSSLGGRRWVRIKCNSNWTAEVNQTLTTASGVSIQTTEGDGDMEKFIIDVSEANLDFDNTKDVVITFHMEDETNGDIVLKQQKGSILTFEFMGQDCNAKNWVFEGSNPGDSNKGLGQFVTKSGGYVLGYYASSKCYLHTNGMQCGAAANDYFEFPAIPGHRLVRVTDTDANGSTKPSICDSGMKVMKGGEYVSTFKSFTPTTWILSETLPGEKYRIVSGNTKTQRINTLELEYE